MRAVFILCQLLVGWVFIHAQKDTGITVPLVSIHFSGQIPGGNLVERFGSNLNAGGSFALKTSRNWLAGVEGNYFFGRNVKEQVVSNLVNPEGFITDNEGYPADLRITERGMSFHLFAGRVFAMPGGNRNSGIMLTVGAGYMEHKIHLYDAQRKVAAIDGALVRGYDRLTGGFSFSQFLGYFYLSRKRMINFYAGIECYEAFTRSYRGLNYNTGLADTRNRLDVLTGIRFGWILPLYKKRPDAFYYY